MICFVIFSKLLILATLLDTLLKQISRLGTVRLVRCTAIIVDHEAWEHSPHGVDGKMPYNSSDDLPSQSVSDHMTFGAFWKKPLEIDSIHTIVRTADSDSTDGFGWHDRPHEHVFIK